MYGWAVSKRDMKGIPDREEALRYIPNMDFSYADWDNFQVRAKADHNIFPAEGEKKGSYEESLPKDCSQMLLSLEPTT